MLIITGISGIVNPCKTEIKQKSLCFGTKIAVVCRNNSYGISFSIYPIPKIKPSFSLQRSKKGNDVFDDLPPLGFTKTDSPHATLFSNGKKLSLPHTSPLIPLCIIFSPAGSGILKSNIAISESFPDLVREQFVTVVF